MARISDSDPGQRMAMTARMANDQPCAPPPEQASDQRRIVLIEKWRPDELELVSESQFAEQANCRQRAPPHRSARPLASNMSAGTACRTWKPRPRARGDSPVPNEGRPEGDGFGIGTRDRRLHIPVLALTAGPRPEAYFRAHVSIASRLSTETPKTIADIRRFYRACTAIGRVSVPWRRALSEIECPTTTTLFRMDTSHRSAKMLAWDRLGMAGVQGAARGLGLVSSPRGAPRRISCVCCDQLDPIRLDTISAWLKGGLQPPK